MSRTSNVTDRVHGLKTIVFDVPMDRLQTEGPAALDEGPELELATDDAHDDAPGLDANATRDAEWLAVFEAVFLVAAADGEIGTAEREQLSALLSDLTSGRRGPADAASVIDQCRQDLDRDDYDARVAEVARRIQGRSARRGAYLMAAGVSFADGQLQVEEDDILAELATAFEIPSDEATNLVERVRRRLLAAGLLTAS